MTGTFTAAPIKSAGFFLGGNAVFTVVVPYEFVAAHAECKERYTFKIVHKDANGPWPECYMVLLLTGPDNVGDYSYMGKLQLRDMSLQITRKSCVGPSAWPKLILERVLACAAVGELDKIEDAGWTVHHEGRCCRCGRRLTVPESIEAGIGPECAGRIQ